MTDNYDGILIRTPAKHSTLHAQRRRDWYTFYDNEFCINKFPDDALDFKIEEGLDDWVRISPEVLTRW